MKPKLIVLLFAIPALTLSAAPQVEPRPTFDAVSIKLIDPDSHGSHWSEETDAKYLKIRGSVHGLILRSYGIREEQLTGEPGWFNTNLYAIQAVSATPTTEPRMILMLRDVLADRFHLKLRQESRNSSVFVLEVAPGGRKFHELKPDEPAAKHPGAPNGIFSRSYTSLEGLLNNLNGAFGAPPLADRPVVDRTQLAGRYDMHLETVRRSEPDAAGKDVPFPDVAHDLQAQLGLKLVSDHASIPCFVVEHADPPTPN